VKVKSAPTEKWPTGQAMRPELKLYLARAQRVWLADTARAMGLREEDLVERTIEYARNPESCQVLLRARQQERVLQWLSVQGASVSTAEVQKRLQVSTEER